ncbi:MAG: division/cell wall cluster transcriptional repressor MraZ [Bacteroidota bacterium]
MASLIGEYGCKLDAKGRFLLPSGLKKQLPENQQSDFVVNRGFESYLVLYPIPVWEAEMERLQGLNQYVKRNRDFVRRFLNGAQPVSLDGNGRMLIPKRLMDYAGLKKEMILIAQIDRVEIWDKDAYDKWMDSMDEDDMGGMAEDVLGGE